MIKKRESSFDWDPEKERRNIEKHGVDFATAAKVFYDPKRKIYFDSKHSKEENRYFCIGAVDGKVLTVRFLYVHSNIRIIGAGFWRKGRQYYEKED